MVAKIPSSQEKTGLLKRLALEVLFESMNIQADPICSILLTSRLPVQLATDIQVITLIKYVILCGLINCEPRPQTCLDIIS